MNKCIIIKNDGLGDLILFSPFIKQLSVKYKIDLVTCIENKEVVSLYKKYLNNVYFISRDSLNIIKNEDSYDLIIPKFDKNILETIKENIYDLALVPRKFIRANSLVVMQFINAKEKYICWLYPTNISKKIANHFSMEWKHIEISDFYFHEQLYYKVFLNKVFKINFTLNKKGSFNKIDGKKIGIGIDGKGWDLNSENIHHWLYLVDSLVSLNFEIYLFGKSNLASEIASKLEYRHSCIVNLVDRISIIENVKIFKELDFYIGNDTGLSHLASEYIGKVLIIHGGAGLGRFFPWPYSKNQYIIFNGMECFDCGWNCIYDKYKCLEEINSRDVVEYIKKHFLGSSKKTFFNTGKYDRYCLNSMSCINKLFFSIEETLKNVSAGKKIEVLEDNYLGAKENFMENKEEFIKKALSGYQIVDKKPMRTVEKLIRLLKDNSKIYNYSFIERIVDINSFINYFNRVDYINNYKMYCNQYHKSISRKIMEHFLSFDILEIDKQDKNNYVFLDVACSTSPVQLILNNQYNYKEIYKQDLNLKVNVESKYKISSNAIDIPLKDNFVDGITLHNSWEHFEGSDDTNFIKEAGRLLKKGGKFIILPLDLADETYILTSPSVWFDKYINLKDIPKFDKNAKIFIKEDKKQRQEKLYSAEYISKILFKYNEVFDFEIICYKNLLAQSNELFNGNHKPYALGASDGFCEFVLVGVKK